jgi:serine/threonine-protein kinase
MLAPGSQFGRYEIQRRLGRGGMGTVYVAHDPVLGRMVAIKLFLSDIDLPDASERFTREARSAAALNHANIVTIYDFGEYDSRPYIAMEYVQGETLAEIIKRKATISLADKLRWIEELCSAAAYAHRIGVVHRDIKPLNLMVDRSGRLKVLDFGIAKMLGLFGSSATTLVGTPGYMAPEQILGGTIDHRADLFSIGVVSYELLSYTEAFPGENTHAITHRLLSEDVTPLAQLVPDLHPDVAAGVERALKKTAVERFGDADDLRAIVARARRQVETHGPDSVPTVMIPRPAAAVHRAPTATDQTMLSSPASISELTPPRESHRTNREGLARRRAAQIEAALERSRAALHAGDLETAADECLQALTLDDSHAAALELEAQIRVAGAKQKAAALIGEARSELGKGALTGAQELLYEARALDPEAVEVKRVERDLRLARVEQERRRQRADAARKATDAADQALASGDVETALALARQALDLEPDSARARAIETEVMRRLDEEAGPAAVATVLSASPAPGGEPVLAGPVPELAATVIVPPKDPAPLAVSKEQPRAVTTQPTSPVAAKPAAPIATPSRPVAAKARPAQQRRMLLAGAAVVVAVAAVAGAIALMPDSDPATGAVLVDALPFATVTGIEAEDGSQPPVPQLASTPLTLTLPVGTYRVRLAGPPPENETRIVTIEVTADGVTTSKVEQFRALTPAEYFEPYLSLSVDAESVDGTADAAAGTAPGGVSAAGVGR